METLDVYAPDSLAVSPCAFASVRDVDALTGLGDLNGGEDRSAISISKGEFKHNEGKTHWTA